MWARVVWGVVCGKEVCVEGERRVGGRMGERGVCGGGRRVCVCGDACVWGEVCMCVEEACVCGGESYVSGRGVKTHNAIL